MGTPSVEQLTADRELVRKARSLTAIKEVAKRYNFALQGLSSFLTAQNKVLDHLDNLAETPPPHHLQGSAVGEPAQSQNDERGGCSPLPGRRLSYSQALGQCKKSSGLTPLGKAGRPVPRQQQRRSVASLHKPSQDPPVVADLGEGHLPPPMAEACPVQWHPPSPAFEEEQPPAGQQPVARPAAKGPAAKRACRSGVQQQKAATISNAGTVSDPEQQPEVARSSMGLPLPPFNYDGTAQQRLGQAEAIASLQAEVASLRAMVSALQQQQQQSHGVALSAAHGVTALQETVGGLQNQLGRQEKLHSEVSALQGRQLQLEDRQQRTECQRAVRLSVPAALLPEGGSLAARMQSLLDQRLGSHLSGTVTVVQAAQLGRRDGGGSPGSSEGRASFKVTLGSGAQRDAVLRAKARALKGTPISIDVLLTSQQLAARRALQSAARAAEQAGQRVQWRYGRLFIDGQEHGSGSSLPPPRQQQQLRSSAGAGQADAQAAAVDEVQTAGDDSWQEVPSRKRAKQPQRGRGVRKAARQGGSNAAPPSPCPTVQERAGDSASSGDGAAAQRGGAGSKPNSSASEARRGAAVGKPNGSGNAAQSAARRTKPNSSGSPAQPGRAKGGKAPALAGKGNGGSSVPGGDELRRPSPPTSPLRA